MSNTFCDASRQSNGRYVTPGLCPVCKKLGCDTTAQHGPFNLYYGLEPAGCFVTLDLALRCHNVLKNLKNAAPRLYDRHGVPISIPTDEQRKTETAATR